MQISSAKFFDEFVCATQKFRDFVIFYVSKLRPICLSSCGIDMCSDVVAVRCDFAPMVATFFILLLGYQSDNQLRIFDRVMH